jgi:phosphate transport system protein
MARGRFHQRLDAIRAEQVLMTGLVADSLAAATRCLFGGDPDSAARAGELRAELESRAKSVEDQAFLLLATEQPVAVDLRAVVSAFRVVSSLQRMSVLADHIAQAGLRRHPEPAVPTPAVHTIAEMARIAESMAIKVGSVVAHLDAATAGELDGDDDAMDELLRQLFLELLTDWPYGVESAIDLTLLGRYYERYADHVVAIADEIRYLVTGVAPL